MSPCEIDKSSGKSNTDYSDENTSLLTVPQSRDSDDKWLRWYRERKLKKLVDKCRVKNIRFTQYYVEISSKMAVDPKSCMDEELIDLMTECLTSLGSDDERTGGSSSDSSGEVECSNIKVEVKKDLVTPTPRKFDKTNQYNQAWAFKHQQHQNICSSPCSCCSHHETFLYGAKHSRLTPQEQHDIFNNCSLEVYPHQGVTPFPMVSPHQRMFLNQHSIRMNMNCSSFHPMFQPTHPVLPTIVHPQPHFETDTAHSPPDVPNQPIFTSTPESDQVSTTTTPTSTVHEVNAVSFNEVLKYLFPILKRISKMHILNYPHFISTYINFHIQAFISDSQLNLHDPSTSDDVNSNVHPDVLNTSGNGDVSLLHNPADIVNSIASSVDGTNNGNNEGI